MTTTVAFDIGGVIVNKISRVPYNESLISIKLYVEKLKPSNVYILSKAKNKWIKNNLELFDKIDFYNKTGIIPENVIFVDEYIDKQTVCNKLGINYMIDDSIKVIRYMQYIDTIPIWFGNNNLLVENLTYINAPKWKSIRKFLQKISKN